MVFASVDSASKNHPPEGYRQRKEADGNLLVSYRLTRIEATGEIDHRFSRGKLLGSVNMILFHGWPCIPTNSAARGGHGPSPSSIRPAGSSTSWTQRHGDTGAREVGTRVSDRRPRQRWTRSDGPRRPWRADAAGFGDLIRGDVERAAICRLGAAGFAGTERFRHVVRLSAAQVETPGRERKPAVALVGAGR